ncbi:cell differentiation protein rcd1-like [Oryza glaberrima]|uniref:cell differentiation protein rcd1-like n=1 Tax=Oryza glaberrima TaxID=4538 RepID=UPI00224C4872|nr:cell differentiation protein rcd1-like [Oryza glaberrima]
MLTSEVPSPRDPELVERLILDLLDPELKGHALSELRKKREMFQNLAMLLWNSFGTVAALIQVFSKKVVFMSATLSNSTLAQEIVVVYPALSPPTLSLGASNRVCNALALLQCIASHPETRTHFLQARIPLYLCAFLETDNKAKQFEYLRLTSLGVIGALVKVDDPKIINFLLENEFVPLCLHNMTIGSELSKTVATFITEKIVVDDAGLAYVCANADRFYAVGAALATVVTSMVDQPSKRLLKHVIRCYLRMSENPRGFAALQTCLPPQLKDGTFNSSLRDDPSGRHLHQQLLVKMTSGKKGGGAGNSAGHVSWG